jgi:Cof subfamily protein (haloacid dehalogenase superfamily)
MSKIKAIILDIDGVIVGEKIGYNSPNPHPDVISAMKKIQNSGFPIVLCTAKPSFAIQNIIRSADLNNFHITDGGGVVVDTLSKKILSKHIIPKDVVQDILSTLLAANVYTEIYTTSNYIIQKSQNGDFTSKHELVLQALPTQVDSLINESENVEVVKIMPIAKDLTDKENVDKILKEFIPNVVLSWGVHPVILPLQFGIVTAPGISKKIAAEQIMNQLGIDSKDVLAVGDSTSDWQFIESCGYKVSMGNGSKELKDLVSSGDHEKSFIAPSVEENGILEVFRHFSLDF